ncbi:PTS sugar transporter subunit IIA [Pediococcus argentinicus]|uniref:PTS sugar transporter subunit IIA n=1 Tax=Pediococcus argentinicus TaxID=480391 RepID=UPI00338E6FDE
MSESEIKVADYLNTKMTLLSTDFSNNEELFEQIAKIGLDNNYVTEDFLPKIKKREQEFPTGLQLEKQGVAIPHTDADTIKHEFVAVITNKNPIGFKRMDDPSEEVKAQVIFVLGLNMPHAQLEMLQALMSIIQNNDLLDSVKAASSFEEVQQLLN